MWPHYCVIFWKPRVIHFIGQSRLHWPLCHYFCVQPHIVLRIKRYFVFGTQLWRSFLAWLYEILEMWNSHLCLSLGYAPKFMCLQMLSTATDMYAAIRPVLSIIKPASLCNRLIRKLMFPKDSICKSEIDITDGFLTKSNWRLVWTYLEPRAFSPHGHTRDYTLHWPSVRWAFCLSKWETITCGGRSSSSPRAPVAPDESRIAQLFPLGLMVAWSGRTLAVGQDSHDTASQWRDPPLECNGLSGGWVRTIDCLFC